MDFLGRSAKRVVATYSNAGVTYADLVNEGWVAAMEAIAAGETAAQAHKIAERRMNALAWRSVMPVSGDDHALRKIRIVGGVPPDYPNRSAGAYTRRLTPSQWRQLRATFHRVLTPRQAHVLTRMVCEHASLAEVAMELGLGDHAVSQIRSNGIRRMLQVTGAAA